MTRIYVGLVILVTCAVSGSLASAQQLPITSLDVADGLVANDVLRIVKDSHGWLWFCTDEGLSHFDGSRLTNFGKAKGLPDARVSDLLETKSGEYWLATGAGVVRFNPKGGATMFSLVPWPEGGRRANSARVLHQDRSGAIWVGTDQGLFLLRVDGDRAALSPIEIGLPDAPDERLIYTVLDDRHGNLWIGSKSGLYRRWPDGSFARYTTADGLPGRWVQDLFESRGGNLWAGTRLNGFFRFTPGESGRDIAVDRQFTDPFIPTSWVSQLFETQDGRFWAATGLGLVMFESEAATASRRFQFYGRRNGVREPFVTSLAEDMAGNLWLGTQYAGAMKLASGGLTTYGERDGIDSINAVFEDRTGRLCYRGHVIGDYNANRSVFEGARVPLVGPQQLSAVARVGCFDGQTFDAFWPHVIRGLDWLDGWNHDRVTLQTRRGDWWVASGDGLYHFPAADRLEALRTAVPLASYSRGSGLSSRWALRLFEDSEGLVWISTTGELAVSEPGLARWNPDTGTLQDLSGSPGLPNVAASPAGAFAEDAAGDVWIGFDGVLARYRQGGFRTFVADDGVPSGEISALYRDVTGTIWFASTRSGLVRITEPDSERPKFSVFGTEQGLSSNTLYVVVDDLGGQIYTGGGRGIDRFDPLSGRVTHLSTSDVLPPSLLGCAFRDRRGVLWFGTTKGLLRLTPASSEVRRAANNVAAPPVYLSGIQVDGTSQPISAIGESDVTLPELDSGQHDIQISFGGLHFASGGPLSYQFRLGGGSAQWSTPTTDRSVTYANLAGGSYEFLVRAVAPDGAVSATPARVSFSILDPLWQRPWFVALSLALLALGARVAYRVRVTRLLQVANMRTRIASDLHDDIGSNLTRIALLSDAAADADGRDAAIGRIARESVGAMSDIVWAIKPERESPVDLARRMRLHADDLFGSRDVALRFNAPPPSVEMKLEIDIRRDVLLFFKEAVTNVARHSHCTTVAIDFIVDRSLLTLTIADNGVGFDTSIDRDGQGLRGLRRRAARLGATLVITSSPGQGAVVSLNLPL